MVRARDASRAAGFAEDARNRERFAFSVDFTIARELVEVRRFSAENDAEGCHIHLEIVGNGETKSRVLEAVSQLPSVKRTYRMTYEGTGKEGV